MITIIVAFLAFLAFIYFVTKSQETLTYWIQQAYKDTEDGQDDPSHPGQYA